MLYGIGPSSLAESLEVTKEQAMEFQESFRKKYKGVTKYLEVAIKECREKSYIETIKGRRRYFPDIKSKDTSTRMAAERCAINTICQGSAADLVKVAMIRIWKRLEADSRITHIPCHINKRDSGAQGIATQLSSQLPQKDQCLISSARLILQIHDELLYEVAEQDLEIVKVCLLTSPQTIVPYTLLQAIVKEEMETSVEISIPFIVNLSVGKTWGNLVPVT
jgi:DNA polymerase theta